MATPKDPPIPDYKGFEKYFRFQPAAHHTQAGFHFTPLMGETEVGCIYPVNDETRAAILADHDEWEAVSKYEYDAQEAADHKEQVKNAV